MSHPRLPQELTDYIIDILQDEPKTLEQCRLVSKSWLPRAQKHLFAMIRFESPTDPTAWMRTFPDLANSPGRLARSLYIACVGDVAAAVVGSRDWSRSFLNVVRFQIRSDKLITPLRVSEIVCSLPRLKDLNITGRCIGHDRQPRTFQPQTSPPLTGTLSLDLPQGMQRTTRMLLDLPNGIHFRRFVCTRHLEIHFRCMTTLVEACSHTLGFIDIRFHPFPTPTPWEGSIVLSTATKLKQVDFQPVPRYVKWVTMGLETIQSTHEDLQGVKIIIPFLSTPIDKDFNEAVYTQWAGLDRVLVQLWRSYPVRVKLVYIARSEPEAGERVCEFIKNLLPETMKGDAIDVVDSEAYLC